MHEGIIIERREVIVQADITKVYEVLKSLGGEEGWLAFDWAWKLRGIIDRLWGGVGLRRGRRDPNDLRVGDALDFWRVELIEPNRLLRLRSEMITPGDAWLQFDMEITEEDRIRLRQVAYFTPKGLLGLIYWYLLYPFHGLVFSGLINGIKNRAESNQNNGK
jgi:hypothetical protein